MRTTVLILSIFILGVGCSRKDQSKTFAKEGKDSLISINNNLKDTAPFVGFIEKCIGPSANEVYVELYLLNEKMNLSEYDGLIQFADSLIYRNEEIDRYKFRDTLASKYFDLRALSNLRIFDEKSDFYCNAKFLHVEYLRKNIEPAYIAVFKTEKTINKSGYFAVSNIDLNQIQVYDSVTTDPFLTRVILGKLNESYLSDSDNNGIHWYDLKGAAVLSTVNGQDCGFITQLMGNDFNILYKSPVGTNFAETRFLWFTSNKFPCILSRNFVPNSGIIFENLLFFNGKKYTVAHHQRIKYDP